MAPTNNGMYVFNVEKGTASNGGAFVKLRLQQGEITTNATCWDNTANAVQVGDVIWGQVTQKGNFKNIATVKVIGHQTQAPIDPKESKMEEMARIRDAKMDELIKAIMILVKKVDKLSEIIDVGMGVGKYGQTD